MRALACLLAAISLAPQPGRAADDPFATAVVRAAVGAQEAEPVRGENFVHSRIDIDVGPTSMMGAYSYVLPPDPATRVGSYVYSSGDPLPGGVPLDASASASYRVTTTNSTDSALAGVLMLDPDEYVVGEASTRLTLAVNGAFVDLTDRPVGFFDLPIGSVEPGQSVVVDIYSTSSMSAGAPWNSGAYSYLDVRVNLVPEPQQWAMLSLGLGLIAWAARRRVPLPSA